MKVTDFEWKVEEIDEFDDIVSCSHFDTYAEAVAYAKTSDYPKAEICLVRDVMENVDGEDRLQRRAHAYVMEDDNLEMTLLGFEETTIPVLPKYIEEVKKYHKGE